MIATMLQQPPLTSSSSEMDLHETFPFVDGMIESAVWAAMADTWGQPDSWSWNSRMFARQFLAAMQSVTVDNLSFSDLKDRVDTQTAKVRLHRVLWSFLRKAKALYHGPDEGAFHELMGRLERAGDSYSILFKADVHGFDDVAYCDYYKRHNFYVVRTRNDVLKIMYREVLMNAPWTFRPKPTQERLDGLFRFIDDVTALHPVERLEDFDIPFLFDLMDELKRRVADGAMTHEERHSLIVDILHLYRYCIRRKHSVMPWEMIDVPEILNSPLAVKFFSAEYVNREVTYVFNHRYSSPHSGVLVTLDIENIVLRSAYARLLHSGKVSNYEYWKCKDTLVESLGRYADTVGLPGRPFDEEMLHYQVDYYRRLFKSDGHRSEAIAFVKAFYISIDEQTNGAFFRDAETLTYRLLASRRFVSYCDEGYVFHRYSPYDRVTEGRKIVFLVSHMNRQRKHLLSEDHIAVDFSAIRDNDYRSIAWRAVTSTKERLCRPSFRSMLCEVLPFLSRLKGSAGYRFPQRNVITAWDAAFISEYYKKKCQTVSSYNNAMMDVRSFIRWARNSKAFIIDIGVFKVIENRKTNKKPTNTPVVSDEELTALTAYFAKRARESTLYGQALILLNLSIITPLRIGHSCSLLHSELTYDEKMRTFFVTSTSKGTRGGVTEIVLGGRADDFILKAKSLSQKIGMDCTQEDLRQQLFLYEYNGKYNVFTPKKFGALLSDACQELGLPHYTAKNLRATYMTKAYVEASANGYANEFVLKLFAYHKNAGTTLEHYVNHAEALAALTDFIKRGNDWNKTVYPDEARALREVIGAYMSLIAAADDGPAKDQLRLELRDYEKQLEAIK